MPAHPHAETALLRVVLGLAAAFILAVLAAHPLVRRIERRLGLTVLISSGVPFLVMGVVFRHPSVRILTDDVMTDLRPALEFGLGWLGFALGMNFAVRELDALPPKTGNVVFAESFLPFAMVFVACALMLVGLSTPSRSFEDAKQAIFSQGFRDSLRDALALGACAAPAAPIAAVAIARTTGSASALLVSRVTVLNDVAGVIVLGVTCAAFRPVTGEGSWQLPSIAWVLVTMGLGGVLGILTYILVRSARNASEETALLLGAISLSAGMAGYLGLSPLVVCALAGALLTNLPFRGMKELRDIIAQVERPLYLIFLLIAGAEWDPSQWQGWALVPVFVLARIGGKLVGAHIAARTGPEDTPDGNTLGLALSPQSPISIATIVGFVVLYKTGAHRPAADGSGGAALTSLPWLMTVVVGGGVVTELAVQAIARIRGGLTMEARLTQLSIHSIHPPALSMSEYNAPETSRSPAGDKTP